MKATAKLSYLRIAPRKVRLVVDMVRGKAVEEAETILNFTTKRGTIPVLKLLKQAEANAKNNLQLDPANLYISKITVDEGPKYKRWMPRARGQAYEIQKKTSHINIVLDELKVTKKKKVAKKAEKAIAKVAPAAEEKKEEVKEIKPEKPKFKPIIRTEKPKVEKGIRRFFRRKVV